MRGSRTCLRHIKIYVNVCLDTEGIRNLMSVKIIGRVDITAYILSRRAIYVDIGGCQKVNITRKNTRT